MLFVEGMGRIDLPGADKEKMFNSLQKLKKLDDDIEIYPGHDYGSKLNSTIGDEKKNNTYMKISKEEIMGVQLLFPNLIPYLKQINSKEKERYG